MIIKTLKILGWVTAFTLSVLWAKGYPQTSVKLPFMKDVKGITKAVKEVNGAWRVAYFQKDSLWFNSNEDSTWIETRSGKAIKPDSLVIFAFTLIGDEAVLQRMQKILSKDLRALRTLKADRNMLINVELVSEPKVVIR